MSWKVIGARFQISQRVCRIPVSVKLRWIIPENIFSWKLGGWCFLILWNWWVKVLSLYHATWVRWNHVLYDKIKGCISSDRVDLSTASYFFDFNLSASTIHKFIGKMGDQEDLVSNQSLSSLLYYYMLGCFPNTQNSIKNESTHQDQKKFT